jgi:hypothetical protein
VSLLIVGGLLIVGVLAIVGVVMLSINEQRSEAAKGTAMATSQAQSALPGTSHAVEVPNSTGQAQPETGNTSRAVDIPTSGRPTVRLDEGRAFVSSDEGDLRATLNGQFRELSHEIHSLHDQAWQLTQRLGALTDMIDHIEGDRGGHTTIEEDTAIPFSDSI